MSECSRAFLYPSWHRCIMSMLWCLFFKAAQRRGGTRARDPRNCRQSDAGCFRNQKRSERCPSYSRGNDIQSNEQQGACCAVSPAKTGAPAYASVTTSSCRTWRNEPVISGTISELTLHTTRLCCVLLTREETPTARDNISQTQTVRSRYSRSFLDHAFKANLRGMVFVLSPTIKL